MNDLTVLSDAELDAVAGGFFLNVSHNKVNVAIVDATLQNNNVLTAFEHVNQSGGQNIAIVQSN